MTATATYGPRRARHYDERARRWEATIGRMADRAIDDAIVAAAQAPVTVLDIGAGTGRNLTRLRRLRRPVLAYQGEDVAPAMLTVASARAESDDVATFTRRDALDDAPWSSADLVLCTWVVGHAQDPARLLRRARERVAPAGSLVVAAVTTPERGPGTLVAAMLGRRWGVTPVPVSLVTRLEPRSVRTFLAGALTVAVWQPHPARQDPRPPVGAAGRGQPQTPR